MANVSMRKTPLICHPDSTPLNTEHVDVEIKALGHGRLSARFTVQCDTDMLLLPKPLEPVRSDGLWQNTCFELFVKRAGGKEYFEYNFSPSTQWALYRFLDYRNGMAEEMAKRPEINCDYSDNYFALNAEFDLPDGWHEVSLMIGVSAVIEERDGRKSYWALAHPPGQPDFHHKDCFAQKLDAPSPV